MNTTMTRKDYEKLRKTRENSPDWMKVDEGNKFNYVLARAGEGTIAIDDDYMKTDIPPINRLKTAKRLESGLYLLENQTRTVYGVGRIDHTILPVYLAGLIGAEEDIDPQNACYMLIKRSATGIPQFVADEDGNKKELNFSLALIVGDIPDFKRFFGKEIQRMKSPISPAVIKDGDNLISVLNLEAAFRDFTGRFCSLYPELSQYYPFSPDFKFKEYGEKGLTF